MKHCTRTLLLASIVSMTGWSMTARGVASMADIRNPTTLCVGRLVANLPTDAKPATKSTFQYIETEAPKPVDSFDSVEKQILTEEKKYAGQAMQRSARHDAMARAAGFDPDKLYGKTRLVGFKIDKSFRQAMIGYHPKVNSARINTEVHKFVDNLQYVFESEDGGADDYPKTSAAMWSAAQNFQPLQHGEIPTAPGFCVAGGMFADAGHPPLHESFTLVASFKNHPDARFSIDAHAIAKVDTDEPSLKHRVDGELGILRANVDGRVAVLVRGEREVAGQQGYQIGLSVPNDTAPNTTAYKFFWAADGTPNDASRPAMEVSLTIQPDEDKPASFADAKQAQALWDELLQGLHIRPGSVAR